MIEWPEFAAEVRRIYTMERELHEDLTRDIADLIRRAMQR
jgi:DNA-directed RNA polymerase subunit F